MSDDDKRAAAAIQTSLSGYLMSGALAVLGADAALAAFIFDKRDDLTPFYILTAAAWATLVASIFFGGRGISEIYSSGHDGLWKGKASGGKFGKQAALCLVGVTLAFLSLLTGTPKGDGRVGQNETLLLPSIERDMRDVKRLVLEERLLLEALRKDVEEIRRAHSAPTENTPVQRPKSH